MQTRVILLAFIFSSFCFSADYHLRAVHHSIAKLEHQRKDERLRRGFLVADAFGFCAGAIAAVASPDPTLKVAGVVSVVLSAWDFRNNLISNEEVEKDMDERGRFILQLSKDWPFFQEEVLNELKEMVPSASNFEEAEVLLASLQKDDLKGRISPDRLRRLLGYIEDSKIADRQFKKEYPNIQAISAGIEKEVRRLLALIDR